MKTLSPNEIECLLEVRAPHVHPLDILGYGYNSEGARRFRAEQPDFLPQIVAYVRNVLIREGVFPKETYPCDPGFRTFIQADGVSFRVSSLEEVSLHKSERVSTEPMSATEAVHEFIRRVANPDYVHLTQSTD